jgi:tetratricopeptide (TPR) repeat protein
MFFITLSRECHRSQPTTCVTCSSPATARRADRRQRTNGRSTEPTADEVSLRQRCFHSAAHPGRLPTWSSANDRSRFRVCRHPVAFLGWTLVTLLAVLCSSRIAAASSGDSAPATVTFSADVQPILQSKCVSCHQEHGDAPFPLETFNQVRRRSAQIVDVIASGYMPPWKPAPDSLPILGTRRLSDQEKRIITGWVASGMPEGRPRRDHVRPRPTGGWLWGTPDLIVSLPEYVLGADANDVFRNFVVQVPFQGTRYVRTFQLRPGSIAIHHANVRVDRTSASADLDETDPEPGYEGVILHSADYPEGHFLGWTPGQSPPPESDLAWPLAGGTWLVVQLHMRGTGKVEHVQPTMGFYFAKDPPQQRPAMIRLGRQDLHIAAGQKDFSTADSFTTPVATTVVAIQPHAHYRARDVEVTAVLPDGSIHKLLHIADWDFDWQDQYRLATPLRVPAGTTFKSVISFDNSAQNPRNPTQPPQDVQWGWRSFDEMADVWLQTISDNENDRQVLTVAARKKATTEDAIGAELLIAREPEHFNLRNDAAQIYLELQQPAKALEHFEAAERIRPQLAPSAYNVGLTLELLGRSDEAAASYRRAISLDGAYAPAQLRLGAIDYRAGDLERAIEEYQEALRVAPALSQQRCELARMLTEADRPAEAVAHYTAALKTEPDNLACSINFAWVLAAHERPEIRRPARAIEMAQHAVSIAQTAREEVLALDVLGAALAAAGKFVEAEAACRRALTLANDAVARDGLSQRLSLYIQRQPFVVITHATDARF